MKPKIYLSLINNFGFYPDYFVSSLIQLLNHTKEHGIEVQLGQVKANSVEAMRNHSIQDFLKSDCTHYMAMDVDHILPPELILRLLSHCKDVVVPQLSRRTLPPRSAQGRDYEKLFMVKENDAPVENKEELLEIEISGPPGMLIRREVLEKMKKPWFVREFTLNTYEDLFEIGSDVRFCKKLKEMGYKIFLDLGCSLPHNSGGFFVDRHDLRYVNPDNGHLGDLSEFYQDKQKGL